jgi:hypothetical protein
MGVALVTDIVRSKITGIIWRTFAHCWIGVTGQPPGRCCAWR